MGENETIERGFWKWLAPGLALILCLVSARLRYEAAVHHEAFDAQAPESVLRSDPALLFHLTQRVVEAGGTPADWHAEPRLAWPGTVDVPATYTVGQEYIVLAARRLLGDTLPLHVLTLGVMALVAALAGIGVYLITVELTGSARLGFFATLVHGILPASYRTVGFVLVREDLALPLFALHLGLGLRAARTGGALAWAAAGLSLGAVMATWHAGSLLATATLCVLALGAVFGAGNPLAARRAPIAWVVLVAVCLAVPALRAKTAVLDLPVLIATALVFIPRISRRHVRLGLPAVLLGALFFRLVVLPSTDMGHVTRMLLAKLVFVGVPPGDPHQIGFEARMMWQGPFATLWPSGFWGFLRIALLFVPLIVAVGISPERERGEAFLVGLLCFGLVLAFLAQRMIVLPAIVLPPLLALGARRAARDSTPPFGTLGVAALVFFQALLFAGWISKPALPWYHPVRAKETRLLTSAVQRLVPPQEAIAADFLLNPVLLATCGNPMVLQPKWEQRAARERVEVLWHALYQSTPEEFAAVLEDQFDCRWFAVDRQMLGALQASRYLAGLPAGQGLLPGSAALAVCGGDGDDVPGMELVWESPWKGEIPGLYRLYRVNR